jgi:ABC-type methionine transport system permease subunit
MSNFAFIPLLQAAGQTLYMVFIASFLGILLGLIGGIFLFLTQKNRPLEQLTFYRIFGFLVNVGRSIPFIILLISIIPVTRLLVGSSIGINAAIVPLALTAFPFFARVTESALSSVPVNLIETGHALGATIRQIVCKMLLPEATPSLVKGATLTNRYFARYIGSIRSNARGLLVESIKSSMVVDGFIAFMDYMWFKPGTLFIYIIFAYHTRGYYFRASGKNSACRSKSG